MTKEYLGEFEELVLILVAALKSDAYGAAIAEQIEEKLNRNVNFSGVHVALYPSGGQGIHRFFIRWFNHGTRWPKEKDLYHNQRRNGNA
jgi:hypothetical protein